ncbi:hypothetical protein MNBD_ALPHA03-1693 [hydrothermal vent metagenome]|uniref:MipA/OmpV family protein n=1 Tax=hydrothermal vent metagenome TaxID=652676 RepID=A0A3B1B5C7_9ZZZZ
MLQKFNIAVLTSLFVMLNSSITKSQEIGGFIAIGPAFFPGFEGSKNYKAGPIVVGRIQLREYYFEAEGTSAKANILPRRFFSLGNKLSIQAGPVFNYRFSRNIVESNPVKKFRNEKGVIELGGFVTVQVKGVLREGDALAGQVKIIGDVSGIHGGQLITLRGSYNISVGQSWGMIFSADSTYVTEKYVDTYFSIDIDNADRSGLAVYNANKGVKDISFDFSLQYKTTNRWGILTYLRASRLLGSIANSPIVKSEGSPNQFIGGIAVSYSF